jgi:thymidylate synthase
METNNVLLDLIKQIADAKEVSEDAVVMSLEDAMKKAYEKEDIDACAKVTIDKLTGKIALYKVFSIIDDKTIEIDKTNENEEKIYNENNQILLSQALKLDKNAVVGGTINKYIDINTLPRRVVAHILQVLKHDVSIESNKLVYKQ